MSIRGSKRRPWLEIVRPETEGRYLSYQLFTLRRSANAPYDDVRSTLAGRGYYDSERIRFRAEGIEQAYGLLYPRDERVITKQVMDLVGILGLTALWIDRGRINSSKRGSIRGKYTREEFDCFRDAYQAHGVACSYSPIAGGNLVFSKEGMKDLKALLAPHTHYDMRAKLMLRKPRNSSGSKSADRPADQLLRQR